LHSYKQGQAHILLLLVCEVLSKTIKSCFDSHSCSQGQANVSLSLAREVLSKTITSQQIRADDMMLREGLAVANVQQVRVCV